MNTLQMNREEVLGAQRPILSSAASSNDDVISNRYSISLIPGSLYHLSLYKAVKDKMIFVRNGSTTWNLGTHDR